MSNVVTGSAVATDSSTVVQLNSESRKVLAIAVKARAGNTGSIYFGTDSSVTSTSGYSLDAGDREDWDFGGAVDAADFHMVASSSGDRLDWAMEMEN